MRSAISLVRFYCSLMDTFVRCLFAIDRPSSEKFLLNTLSIFNWVTTLLLSHCKSSQFIWRLGEIAQSLRVLLAFPEGFNLISKYSCQVAQISVTPAPGCPIFSVGIFINMDYAHTDNYTHAHMNIAVYEYECIGYVYYFYVYVHKYTFIKSLSNLWVRKVSSIVPVAI